MMIAGWVMLGLVLDFALAIGVGKLLARRTPPQPQPQPLRLVVSRPEPVRLVASR
jgi:hypothetical protein